ncbi:hypothetical protein E2320_014357, partial [Naja naja]
ACRTGDSHQQCIILLLLLLWTQGVWSVHQAKCPLTLQRHEVYPKNHYRQGEFSIGGITKQMTKYDGHIQFYYSIRRFAEESFMCSYTKDAFSVKVWRRCREREEI